MKSLRKVLNTQSFKRYPEKKKKFFDNLHNNYCIYGNAICHIARLTNIYTGLIQLWVPALWERESSDFLQESSAIKNSLGFIRLYTKRERFLDRSLNEKKAKQSCIGTQLLLSPSSLKMTLVLQLFFPLLQYYYYFYPSWIGPKSTCLYKTILVSDNIIHVQHFIYRKSIRCSKVQTHEHPTVSIIQVLWYNTMFLNNIH